MGFCSFEICIIMLEDHVSEAVVSHAGGVRV
jgi:hypothetical protein